MQKKNLQKRNRRILKVFDNCDFLPAWRFFKVQETDDKRYLIDCDRLPEYDEKYLIDTWDKIIQQYDQITGEHRFENSYLDTNAELEEYKELIILKACYGLMRIGRVECLQILKDDFGVEFKSINYDALQRVRSMIMRRHTSIEIDNAEKPRNESGNNYIQAVVQLQHILAPQIINPMTITTTEWINLNKQAKEIIKARKNG